MPIKREHIVQGNTVEEKLASIESVLRHFSTRLGTKVVGLIPPVVILHGQRVPDDDGRIFAGIMPLNGSVSTVCFSIASFTNRAATVELSITRRDETTTVQKYVCRHNIEVMQPNLQVAIGEILRVNALDPKSMSDILIGALIQPDISSTQRFEQMVDALEALEENPSALQATQEEGRQLQRKQPSRRKIEGD